MKAKATLLAIVGIWCLLASPRVIAAVAVSPLVERLASGSIDWSAGNVRADGMAVPLPPGGEEPPEPPAHLLDIARQKAIANLLKTVAAVRIDATSRIGDRLAADATFRDGLTTLASNAPITHQAYLSDGTVEIKLTTPLTGGFAQYVLPEEIRQVDAVTTMRPEQPSGGADAATAANSADSSHYTGLILDATGIGAVPSLVPLVVDESGETVYGPAFVSREFAVSRGMSGFATALEAARSDDKRVGERPMIIKAIRTNTTGDTDLVVSSADAARLRSSVVHLNFLKACRVIIVMDPPQAADW